MHSVSMRSIDNLKDGEMAEYYLSHRILNDFINRFNPQKPGQNSFPVLTQEFKR